MARGDFRKRLTDKLVAFMEENDGLPWQQGWNAVNIRPFNPGTGVKYKGGNVLNLIYSALERDSDDPRWMTFKQAKAAGFHVKKGAKGEFVEYWDWGQAKAKPQRELDAEGNPVERTATADDEQEEAAGRARKPLVFYAVVFNGSDIEGLPELKRDFKWKPNDVAEKLLAATGASIEHRALSKTAGGKAVANAAYFDPRADKIVVPPRSSFKSDNDYYATVLHELAHWTGHETRLGRLSPDAKFGTPEYAKEELRAEIAAMFLTSMLGVEGDVLNHARYTASWVDVLKKDKHELFRAAKDAEAIIDHIFEYAPELKALADSRLEDNIAKEGPKKKLESGIAPLPDFIPAGAKVEAAPAGVGRDDPRWRPFESAVRTEANKYGITADTVDSMLVLLEPQFTDVMNAAQRNGYTVDDMHEMLLRQLVEEMRLNKEREQQWSKYCDQVRAAAKDVLPVEQVELKLQELGQKYQQLLLQSGQQDWDADRTERAIRELIFGDAGRRAITPDYIKDRFLSGEQAADPDDDLLLTPTGAGLSLGDALPADAAAVADEPLVRAEDSAPAP